MVDNLLLMLRGKRLDSVTIRSILALTAPTVGADYSSISETADD